MLENHLLFLKINNLSSPIAGIINIYALLFQVATEGATAAQPSQLYMKETESNIDHGEWKSLIVIPITL